MSLLAFDPETRNLIDGRLLPASNGTTFENIDPATEEVLGVCADGTKDDMIPFETTTTPCASPTTPSTGCRAP